MPANTKPIYSRVADVSNNAGTGMNQLVTAAANDYTGISANNSLVFTADATNGGYIQRLRFKAGGTNVATVARIYINNGSTPGTAANNEFYGEISLPATTASAVAATVEIDYPMGFAINPGFRIYFGLATAVAAGWICTPVGGRY
jgi:hypothetical protein